MSKFRDPVSGFTHLVAAVFSAVGAALLVWFGNDNIGKQVSLLIYGFSLVQMFTASAVYHLVSARPRVIKALRKFDHAAIYLLIAGSYTPICMHYFTGFWRWGMLAIVWALAVTGVIFKIFIIRTPRGFNTAIYLLMGWLSLVAAGEIFTKLPGSALVWLLLGGVFFTIGAVIYVAKKPNFFPGVFGFHEIWHIFVILGCLCHFVIMAAFIAPSTRL
ncbi:MAG: PAQR family membrane homeostasis protein TrhA [Chloroflexota bacterium]